MQQNPFTVIIPFVLPNDEQAAAEIGRLEAKLAKSKEEVDRTRNEWLFCHDSTSERKHQAFRQCERLHEELYLKTAKQRNIHETQVAKGLVEVIHEFKGRYYPMIVYDSKEISAKQVGTRFRNAGPVVYIITGEDSVRHIVDVLSGDLSAVGSRPFKINDVPSIECRSNYVTCYEGYHFTITFGNSKTIRQVGSGRRGSHPYSWVYNFPYTPCGDLTTVRGPFDANPHVKTGIPFSTYYFRREVTTHDIVKVGESKVRKK